MSRNLKRFVIMTIMCSLLMPYHTMLPGSSGGNTVQAAGSDEARTMFPMGFEPEEGFVSDQALAGQKPAGQLTAWTTNVASDKPPLFTVVPGRGVNGGNAISAWGSYDAGFDNKTISIEPAASELQLTQSTKVSTVSFSFDAKPDYAYDDTETKLWNIQPSRDVKGANTGVPAQVLLYSNGKLKYSENGTELWATQEDGTPFVIPEGEWLHAEGSMDYRTKTYRLSLNGTPQYSSSGSIHIPFKNNQFNATQNPDEFGFFAMQVQAKDQNYKPVLLDNLMIQAYEDTTAPPSDIADLTADSVSTNSVTLEWTSPGHDGTVGTAAIYDIRYSMEPITGDLFYTLPDLPNEPAPMPSGTKQQFTIGGLSGATDYYFAIRSGDRHPTYSGISNVLSVRTVDRLIPSSITFTPDTFYLQQDESMTLEPYVEDQFGEPMEASGLSWESSDPSLAVVENGVVRALASSGKVTVTANAGEISGEVTVELTDRPVPRVAIWNPDGGNVSGENNFTLDMGFKDNVLKWLSSARMNVVQLTADQINDSTVFNHQKFDVLVYADAGGFPYGNLQAIRSFGDQGGVLVGLDTNKVPFLIGLAPENGGWHYYRKTPRFAWETHELMNDFGMEYTYDPGRHDLGVIQQPSELLKQYLPEAQPMTKLIQDRWITPYEDGEFYPLMRSVRGDNKDTTPQMFISKKGSRKTVIAGSGVFTNKEDPELWPHSEQTVIALVQIAYDLETGQLELTPDMKLDLAVQPPEPLRQRLVTGSVDPEHAVPLIRFGLFNGSSIELGEPAAEGSTVELKAPVSNEQIPRYLEPGATLKLPVPALGEGIKYLRVRGAYAASDAGLRIMLGDELLLNELFLYNNMTSDSNGNATTVQKPDEFTRIVFIPSGKWDKKSAVLTLHNPGTRPIYFDAIQAERSANKPEMMIGMGNSLSNTRIETAGSAAIPVTESQKWSTVRTSLRLQYVKEPGQPNRYDEVYKIADEALKLNPRAQFIIEGTPAWAAISKERYDEALAAGRPSTTPPDPEKYAEIVKHLAEKYKDQVLLWEIWNEADWYNFYRGSATEYMELFLTLSAAIKDVNPNARIITTGMAKYNPDFMNVLINSDFTKYADLFSFHPYSGIFAAWENPHGLVEGNLMSRGVNIELFHDEMGFVWKPGEWFTEANGKPYGGWTEAVQQDLYNRALSRLMANGAAKLAVFHAGGDTHHFGLFDENGRPRLAYSVFADYAKLGRPGSTRLDMQMTAADGQPLQGIYHAAAQHEDGSATIILNPSEANGTREIKIAFPIKGNKAVKALLNGEPVSLNVVKAGKGQWFAQTVLTVSQRSVLELAAWPKAQPR